MPLTRRQHEILDYIAGYIADNGYAPSFEEIARKFGFQSLAYSGPETGIKDKVSYVVRQNKLTFVFTTALLPTFAALIIGTYVVHLLTVQTQRLLTRAALGRAQARRLPHPPLDFSVQLPHAGHGDVRQRACDFKRFLQKAARSGQRLSAARWFPGFHCNRRMRAGASVKNRAGASAPGTPGRLNGMLRAMLIVIHREHSFDRKVTKHP